MSEDFLSPWDLSENSHAFVLIEKHHASPRERFRMFREVRRRFNPKVNPVARQMGRRERWQYERGMIYSIFSPDCQAHQLRYTRAVSPDVIHGP